MITNLIATITVCIVTNITSIDLTETTGCPYGAGCLVIGCDRQQKIKVVGRQDNITICEITTLKVDQKQLAELGYTGPMRRLELVLKERYLSNVTKKYRREDKWLEESQSEYIASASNRVWQVVTNTLYATNVATVAGTLTK